MTLIRNFLFFHGISENVLFRKCWLFATTKRTLTAMVKLATVVEVDPKAPFSIATTPRCKRGCYSFPWMAPLYFWSVPYKAECKAKRHQVPFFGSLVWLDRGLNPGLPCHWANTLTNMPMKITLSYLCLKKLTMKKMNNFNRSLKF